MSDVMNVPLSSLVEFRSGGTPARGVAEYFEGDIPWITGADIGESGRVAPRFHITADAIRDSTTTRVESGTILLVTRTSVGKVAVAPFPLCFSQDITALVVDASRMSQRFLVNFLRARRQDVERRARGATIKGVTREVVAGLEVPLFELAVQERIAAVLDQVNALRATRREAIALLDELAQSVFLDMFGDPRTNPKGFPVCTLDELAAPGDRINYGVVQPGGHVGDGVRLIRAGDLKNGGVERSSLMRISADVESKYARSRIKGNEILIGCVGAIGAVAVVEPGDVGSNVARAVARVPVGDRIDREYLAAYLRMDLVQQYFQKELRTVAQPTLNIKQIKETPVVVPPAELRARFTRRVNRLTGQRQAHAAHLATLDELFASLQQRAFAGQLWDHEAA